MSMRFSLAHVTFYTCAVAILSIGLLFGTMTRAQSGGSYMDCYMTWFGTYLMGDPGTCGSPPPGSALYTGCTGPLGGFCPLDYYWQVWVPSGPVCSPSAGTSCSSSGNSCGMTGGGTVQCDGSCSASVPSDSLCPPLCSPSTGASCGSFTNACGASASGTVQCDGTCSGSAPVLPSGYGNTCTSSANSCSMTNSGTIGCTGTCTATPPPDSSCTAPDLTAGPVTPTTATQGAATSFQFLVSNIGNASTGSGFTDLFEFDNDATHTLFSDIFAKVPYSSALLAGGGGSNTAVASYTFGTAGTWYVRGCADLNTSNVGSITESNENNCGSWLPVTVTAASALPTATLVATPSTISAGGSSVLTWSSSGATSCSSASFTVPGGTTSGSASVSPALTSIYDLTCTGAGGSVTVYATVTVSAALCSNTGPVQVLATPNRVQSGSSTTLSVSGANVSGACTLTGPGISQTISPTACSITGTYTTPTLTSQAVYKLSCPGAQSSQTIVNVIPKIHET